MNEKLKNFANAIRALSIDMVNEANSGHQGTPLGFADVMSVLFNEFIDFDPGKTDRDRLILSAGHASPMLYATIYLTQRTALSLDDLKKFRKLGARCQGHPKLDKDIGVEMTTRPEKQGIRHNRRWVPDGRRFARSYDFGIETEFEQFNCAF